MHAGKRELEDLQKVVNQHVQELSKLKDEKEAWMQEREQLKIDFATLKAKAEKQTEDLEQYKGAHQKSLGENEDLKKEVPVISFTHDFLVDYDVVQLEFTRISSSNQSYMLLRLQVKELQLKTTNLNDEKVELAKDLAILREKERLKESYSEKLDVTQQELFRAKTTSVKLEATEVARSEYRQDAKELNYYKAKEAYTKEMKVLQS